MNLSDGDSNQSNIDHVIKSFGEIFRDWMKKLKVVQGKPVFPGAYKSKDFKEHQQICDVLWYPRMKSTD